MSSPARTREAIDALLAWVQRDGAASLEERRELALLLDELAVLAHQPLPECEERDTGVPEPDYETMYRAVGKRLPGFGLYRDSTDLDEEQTVGDTIDDLADIAVDLTRAARTWDQAGEQAGLWEYLFHFEIHWGQHLRALQWALHARGLGE